MSGSTVSCAPNVAPSGATIVVQLLDTNSDPTNVTSYATAFTQLVQITGAGGTFNISYRGQTLMDVPLGADEETLQAGLEALSTIGMGKVTVQGDGYPYLITLDPSVTPAAFFVDATNIVASVAATPLTAGTGASPIILDATVGATFEKIGASWSPVGFSSGAGLKVAADGLGVNSAEWSVTVPTPGNYNVYYCNSGPTGSGNATTVPWRFSDGDTIRGRIVVNQQALVPDNFTLPGDATDAFQLLATVYVASGTLRVLVTDQVAGGDIGKLVCVNKIGVQPVDPVPNLISTSSFTPAYAFPTGSGWGGSAGDYDHSQNFCNTFGGHFTWMFLGLLPGSTYDIYAQWTPFINRTTAAVYSLSDGVTTLGSTTINQQNAPTADQTLTDSFGDSYPFQKIFSVVVPTSSVLILTLPVSNDGSLFTLASAAAAKLHTAVGYTEAVSSSVSNLSTGPPTITVNGTDTRTLVDRNWSTDTNPSNQLPYIGFLVPGPPLHSTDSVTISISNSSIGTVAGTLPRVTNQVVTNCVGGSMGRALPAIRTMGAGWNLYQLGVGFVPIDSNMVKNNVGWIALGGGPTLTSKFLPRFTQNVTNCFMSFGQPSGPNPTSDEGYPLWPQTGTTTFKPDGATAGYMSIFPKPGTTMAFQAMNTGHATGNLITINFAVDGSNTTFAPQFDVYPPNGLYDICDDADAGRFATVGTWTILNVGWNGRCRRNSKSLTDKAIFSFGAISAGDWEASISWVPDPGNTTTAVVVIKEGGIQIATYTVDQTGAPNSHATNDYNFTTLLFDSGTAFTCGGGAITIEIHGGTDGYCLADSVRIACGSTLGSLITPMTDFKAYAPDPGINPSNPDEFHPIALRTLEGTAGIRSMSLQDTNFGCFVEIEDYAQPDQLYYGGEWGLHQYTITKMETWSDPNGFWAACDADFNSALITITPINGAPLPLTSGFKAAFPSGIAVKYADWTIENGHVLDLSTITMTIEYDPGNMATNQFACGNHAFGPGALTTLNPSAPCTVTFGRGGIPIDSYIRLCVAVGADCHLNVPPIVSQACINAIAAFWLAIAPVGTLKLILEISNEPWNFFFPDYWYFLAMAHELGLASGMHAYAHFASERHGWMTTALGGRSGELIRPFNVQLDDASTAANVLNYCNTNSKPVDELLVSAYLGPSPTAQVGFNATYEKFTTGNTVDFVDAFLNLSTRYSAAFAGWQATALAQSVAAPLHRTCRWGIYEGGQASNNVGGSTDTKQRQSFAGRYDPAEFGVTISYLAMAQHYNAVRYYHYALDQTPSSFGSDAIDVMFGVMYKYGALAGRGDGSDGLFDNRPMIAGAPPGVVNFNNAVSPIALSYNVWNGVSGSSSAIFLFSILGGAMNFLPSNYRINVLNGLQATIPPDKITCTLSPYTIPSTGAKLPGSDVPLIAASDASAASAAIAPGSYGASAKITGNTFLSGDIAVQIDLRGVVGLKPAGTVTFYLEVCGTTINPPDGQGLAVLTIPVDKAGIFTGTVCLDGLLPELV